MARRSWKEEGRRDEWRCGRWAATEERGSEARSVRTSAGKRRWRHNGRACFSLHPNPPQHTQHSLLTSQDLPLSTAMSSKRSLDQENPSVGAKRSRPSAGSSSTPLGSSSSSAAANREPTSEEVHLTKKSGPSKSEKAMLKEIMERDRSVRARPGTETGAHNRAERAHSLSCSLLACLQPPLLPA